MTSLAPCPPCLTPLEMPSRAEILLDPLITFLQVELSIPADAIALGLERTGDTPTLLPMVLWQYGLVTLAELECIFDWVERHSVTPLAA